MVACSRLSDSGRRAKSVGVNKEKTREGAGEGAEGETVRLSLVDQFWYTSPQYTL